MQSLSKQEQIKLISAIPESRLIAASEYFNTGGGGKRGGDVGSDILGFFKNTLGPIITEIAPTVFHEILLPLIKGKIGLGKGRKTGGSKSKGCGLSLAGNGLKFAGQGKMMKDTGKGSEAMKIKMAKVRNAKKKK